MEQRKEDKERSKETEEKNPPPPPSCEARNSVYNSAKNTVFHTAGRKMGLTDSDVDAWLDYQRETEWQYPSGRPVTARNFHRSLRMWRVIKERIAERNAAKLERAAVRQRNSEKWIAARDAAEEKRRAEAVKARQDIAATEEGWILCREECVHCSGVGCTRGVKIPPAHQSWPKPPRECPMYQGKMP